MTMNPTSTDAGRTVTAAPRSVGSQAVGAASRQLLATAGNQVLKAAVDRAVNRVDRTAGRLDALAAREPRQSRPRVAGTSPDRAAGAPSERRTADTVRAKVGASLSFVAQRAMLLLQLVQRLARQLLDALRRLLHRDRADGPDESGDERAAARRPVQNARRTKPGDGPRVSDGGEPVARRPRPAQPPQRRPRPAAGAPEAPVRRRRVAGERPARAGDDA
jgi:hypothetical protein